VADSVITEELIDLMHNETQGIPRLAITLYSLAQSHAIGRSERLTADGLRDAARKGLKPVQPYLNALRTGNTAFLNMQDISFEPLREQVKELAASGALLRPIPTEIKKIVAPPKRKPKKPTLPEPELAVANANDPGFNSLLGG
jgi:hypothetical protein